MSNTSFLRALKIPNFELPRPLVRLCSNFQMTLSLDVDFNKELYNLMGAIINYGRQTGEGLSIFKWTMGEWVC